MVRFTHCNNRTESELNKTRTVKVIGTVALQSNSDKDRAPASAAYVEQRRSSLFYVSYRATDLTVFLRNVP